MKDKVRLPTPQCKLNKRDGLKTIFHSLDEALEESKKWDMNVSITLEDNGYYRFFGHGVKVY